MNQPKKEKKKKKEKKGERKRREKRRRRKRMKMKKKMKKMEIKMKMKEKKTPIHLIFLLCVPIFVTVLGFNCCFSSQHFLFYSSKHLSFKLVDF